VLQNTVHDDKVSSAYVYLQSVLLLLRNKNIWFTTWQVLWLVKVSVSYHKKIIFTGSWNILFNCRIVITSFKEVEYVSNLVVICKQPQKAAPYCSDIIPISRYMLLIALPLPDMAILNSHRHIRTLSNYEIWKVRWTNTVFWILNYIFPIMKTGRNTLLSFYFKPS
jgi:hypothetical protein